MGRLIAWVIEIVVVFVLARLVFRLFGAAQNVYRRPPAPEPRERVGGTLVRDPHCGTYVPVSRALEARSGQETIYFCSTECRDAYKQRA